MCSVIILNYFCLINIAPALIYDENEDLGKPNADCLNKPICLSETEKKL